MGRFFANQKLDAAGLVGVTLQKLLIFFMILDAAAFFFGLSFFSSFLSLLFHFVVFMGVYRRRTGVLLVYVILHVAVLILAAFAMILVVSSLMYVNPEGYDHSSSDSGVINNNNTHHMTYFRTMLISEHSIHNRSTNQSTPQIDVYPIGSDDEYVDQSLLLISIVLLVVSIVVLYTKILSVVLAHKMRKLLLNPVVLPVSNTVDTETQKNSQSEPTYVPADFENNIPFFAQPGFAYQPMMPQNMYPGQSAMMPAPFMYGQHPVFYSYGPAPTNDNEKL